MAKIVVVYPSPEDPAGFDRNYFEHHVPLALKIPHLRSFTVSDGVDCSTGAGIHLIAELGFDSMALMNEALATPECQASLENLATFAPRGITTVAYEVETLFHAA
jgi:uncharacterized protein (TIGR02118 family)